MSYYCRAVLSRSGLGNLLFPWARSVIFSERHQIPMLDTIWLNIRIGTFLRGERDKRGYGGLFYRHGIGGVKRWAVMATGTTLDGDASDAWLVATGAHYRSRPEIFDFSECRNFFAPLQGYESLVRTALWNMTRESYRPPLQREAFVAIHVRRGDFRATPANADVLLEHGHYQIPLDWYKNALIELRRATGVTLPARVYSDGYAHEMESLLKMEKVVWAGDQSALFHLWEMSQASALIGTTSSTFSQWAVYLGQMPSIWHKGQRPRTLTLVGRSDEEGLFDFWREEKMPSPFATTVRDRMSSGWPVRP
jgi:hypothetical protein